MIQIPEFKYFVTIPTSWASVDFSLPFRFNSKLNHRIYNTLEIAFKQRTSIPSLFTKETSNELRKPPMFIKSSLKMSPTVSIRFAFNFFINYLRRILENITIIFAFDLHRTEINEPVSEEEAETTRERLHDSLSVFIEECRIFQKAFFFKFES